MPINPSVLCMVTFYHPDEDERSSLERMSHSEAAPSEEEEEYTAGKRKQDTVALSSLLPWPRPLCYYGPTHSPIKVTDAASPPGPLGSLRGRPGRGLCLSLRGQNKTHTQSTRTHSSRPHPKSGPEYSLCFSAPRGSDVHYTETSECRSWNSIYW